MFLTTLIVLLIATLLVYCFFDVRLLKLILEDLETIRVTQSIQTKALAAAVAEIEVMRNRITKKDLSIDGMTNQEKANYLKENNKNKDDFQKRLQESFNTHFYTKEEKEKSRGKYE